MKRASYQRRQAEYRAAMAINQKLIDEYPTNGNYRDNQARYHNNLARDLASMGRSKEAEAEYRAALTLWRALAEEYPAVTGWQNNLGFLRNNLGDLLRKMGRSNEAEAEFRAAQAVLRKLADEHPDNPIYRENLAYTTVEARQGPAVAWPPCRGAGRGRPCGRSVSGHDRSRSSLGQRSRPPG